MQLAAKQQNLFGAEAVSRSVYAASIRVCIGVFFLDCGEDAVQDRENLLGSVAREPHVDCEALCYAGNAQLDLLDDGRAGCGVGGSGRGCCRRGITSKLIRHDYQISLRRILVCL